MTGTNKLGIFEIDKEKEKGFGELSIKTEAVTTTEPEVDEPVKKLSKKSKVKADRVAYLTISISFSKEEYLSLKTLANEREEKTGERTTVRQLVINHTQKLIKRG